MRRQTLLPLAIAVLNGLAFVAFAIGKLPLLGRYLFPSAAMLALFAAVAALGWTALGEKPRMRRWVWQVTGSFALLVIVAFFPLQQAGRLTDLRTDIRNRYRVDADLHKLVQSPGAKEKIASCGPVYLPNHRPVPQVSYWTGKRPTDVQAIGPAPVSDGTYISPANQGVAELSILDKNDRAPLGADVPGIGGGPESYVEVARNRSWVLWAGDCTG
jgi:4-amino-4-deoxy-L-arabinose transferase-like glycosyltransferase